MYYDVTSPNRTFKKEHDNLLRKAATLLELVVRLWSMPTRKHQKCERERGREEEAK